MSKISDIVQINISRETAAVTRESFNIPLFLAAHTSFSNRANVYTDMEEVAADFPSTSNVYKAASKLFGQERRPPSIVVGRRQVNSVTGSLSAVTASTVYSLTINGTTISVTSDSTPTAIEIVAALRSQFTSAAIVGVTMTDNLNGTFTVGTSSPGAAWSVKSSKNVQLVNVTPTETWSDALSAVEAENDTWYALVAETHLDQDIYELAQAIQARKKIYGTSSSSLAILTSSDTDIASQLKSAGFFRTFIAYSATADTEFIEAGIIGSQITEVPGSNTWKFKRIAGVTRDKLNSTQVRNAFAKSSNTYEYVGGQNIFREGWMANGEFIDNIIFTDWLESRIAENVYSALVNLKKIPFTDAGLTIIQSLILSVLQEGVRNGGLAETPAPRVILPKVSTISNNAKALRTLEGVKFKGTFANAIHLIEIDGTVSL